MPVFVPGVKGRNDLQYAGLSSPCSFRFLRICTRKTIRFITVISSFLGAHDVSLGLEHARKA